MKMDKIANSGNDEFYTPAYAIEPIMKYIKSNSTIWCPFDTEQSLFVKMFREAGHRVVATHLESGYNFFLQSSQPHPQLAIVVYFALPDLAKYNIFCIHHTYT